MDRGGRAVVAGVERLEGVEGFLGQADLADDEPVGSHPQGIGHQVADVEQAALGLAGRQVVGMDRLEVEAIGVLQGQLGGVLDDAHPLSWIEQVGEAAQQGRLAGAGLAGDEDVGLGSHQPAQEVGHLGA